MIEITDALWKTAAYFVDEFWKSASRLPPAFKKSLSVRAFEREGGITVRIASDAPFARAFELGVRSYAILPRVRKALGFSRWDPKRPLWPSRKFIGPGRIHRFLFRWVRFPGRIGNYWLYNIIEDAMLHTENMLLLEFGEVFFDYVVNRVNTKK